MILTKLKFVFLVISLFLIIGIFYLGHNKTFNSVELNVPDVKFPFKNIKDDQGKNLNIILISAPFREEKHEQMYEEYKSKGFYLCGISSYLEFPDKIDNPHEDRYHERKNHDYTKMVSAWIHCFRKVPPILENSKLPLLLLTEADLKDCHGYYKPKPEIKKEYDFIYSCLNDNDKCDPGWNWYNRNWDLAKKCLVIMCERFKLKGLIVGREKCEFTDKCNGLVNISPFMDFHKFQEAIQKARFIFVPNISDASPRVITESLCYNLPALVNYNIVGGWHNIIPDVTGEFFTDETNIVPALEKLLKNYDSYKAREWYINNRGRDISGKVLAEFLFKNYPNINNNKTTYADI